MRYFLVTYVRKPNGQIDEQVQVSRNVKPRDNQICNVILDFKDKKVMKCMIEGKRVETDWEKMYEYYGKVYPNVVEQIEKAMLIESSEKK